MLCCLPKITDKKKPFSFFQERTVSKISSQNKAGVLFYADCLNSFYFFIAGVG